MSPVNARDVSDVKEAWDASKKLSLASDDVHMRILSLPLLLPLPRLQCSRSSGISLHLHHRLLPLFSTPSDLNRRALLRRA
jgi:hypothetical protein